MKQRRHSMERNKEWFMNILQLLHPCLKSFIRKKLLTSKLLLCWHQSQLLNQANKPETHILVYYIFSDQNKQRFLSDTFKKRGGVTISCRDIPIISQAFATFFTLEDGDLWQSGPARPASTGSVGRPWSNRLSI